MRFAYNHKQYEVMELHDIYGICSMGMVVLFEVQYCHYEKGTRVVDSEEDFLSQDDHKDMPLICEELRYVNQFQVEANNHAEIIETCHYFIDHEFDKDFDELKHLMREYCKAFKNFEKDEDKLEELEDAQYELLDYINKNVGVGENDR